MGEAPERLKDAQGHEWPVTGYWCCVCGMPLHPMLRDAGVHLNCEADPNEARAETEDCDG